jgi:hypothetical protein
VSCPAGRPAGPGSSAVAPSARVVYGDNDPLVLAHARALLTSAPEGRTAYIHTDLRDPAAIVSHPVVRDVLEIDSDLQAPADAVSTCAALSATNTGRSA